MRTVSDALDFTRGLEQVLRQEGGPGATHLPETTADLFPTEEQPRAHLTRLHRTNSLGNALLHALTPDLPNKELLSPNRFNSLLGEAATALAKIADQQPDPRVRQAVELLRTDQENKDMLNMYRGLLHKG